MEQNNVTIDLERYNELLALEYELQLAKQILFNDCNRLSFDEKEVYFNVDTAQVKLLFPYDYNLHLIGLRKKEGENV